MLYDENVFRCLTNSVVTHSVIAISAKTLPYKNGPVWVNLSDAIDTGSPPREAMADICANVNSPGMIKHAVVSSLLFENPTQAAATMIKGKNLEDTANVASPNPPISRRLLLTRSLFEISLRLRKRIDPIIAEKAPSPSYAPNRSQEYITGGNDSKVSTCLHWTSRVQPLNSLAFDLAWSLSIM